MLSVLCEIHFEKLILRKKIPDINCSQFQRDFDLKPQPKSNYSFLSFEPKEFATLKLNFPAPKTPSLLSILRVTRAIHTIAYSEFCETLLLLFDNTLAKPSAAFFLLKKLEKKKSETLFPKNSRTGFQKGLTSVKFFSEQGSTGVQSKMQDKIC